jgi:hypothetical protein
LDAIARFVTRSGCLFWFRRATAGNGFKTFSISARNTLDHLQRELEAESVAYLVAKRNGVTPKSETYLSRYAKEDVAIDNIDVYQVMRAAGQIESLLGLTAHTGFQGSSEQNNFR